MNTPDHIISDRGFAYPTAIETEMESEVAVYDSSSAMEDCIWLKVKESPYLDAPTISTVELSFEQVRDLIGKLSWLMERRMP